MLVVFTELLQLILRRDLESRIRIRVDRRRATRATLEAEGVSLFALLSKAYVLTEWIPAPDLLWRAIWKLFPEVDHKIKPGDKPHLVKVSFTASASSLTLRMGAPPHPSSFCFGRLATGVKRTWDNSAAGGGAGGSLAHMHGGGDGARE